MRVLLKLSGESLGGPEGRGVDSRSRWAYYYNIIPRYVMLRAVYRLDLQPKKNRQ